MSDSVARELEKMPQKPVIVASHRRSGTHLTIDLLRRQFDACDSWSWPWERPTALYLNLDLLFEGGHAPTPAKDRWAMNVLARVPRPIIKTHLTFEEMPAGPWLDWLRERSTLLYVTRDGRDVMCSLHLYMQSFDARARVDMSTFLRTEFRGMSPAKYWAHHVALWRAIPGVHVQQFESITKKTPEALTALGEALGLTPRNVQPLLPAKGGGTWQMRLERMFSTRPGSSAILGRYQGKSPLKWREAMSEADRALFCEQAGRTLIELGYEKDDRWVTAGK
ncbi:MAG: hypothetical protein GC162_11735 [Planctomycetes bacterium]|nr:hypothetical protein [Planctomycetota bacterium]